MIKLSSWNVGRQHERIQEILTSITDKDIFMSQEFPPSSLYLIDQNIFNIHSNGQLVTIIPKRFKSRLIHKNQEQASLTSMIELDNFKIFLINI